MIARPEELGAAIAAARFAERCRSADPLGLARAFERRPGRGRGVGGGGRGGARVTWTPLALAAGADSLIWMERGVTLVAGGIETVDDQSGNGRGYQRGAAGVRPTPTTINGRTYSRSDGTQYLAALAAWPQWVDFSFLVVFSDSGTTPSVERAWDRVTGTGCSCHRENVAASTKWGGSCLNAGSPFGLYATSNGTAGPHIVGSRRSALVHDVWVDKATISATQAVAATALSSAVPAIHAVSGGGTIYANDFAFGVWYPTAKTDAFMTDAIRKLAAYYKVTLQ